MTIQKATRLFLKKFKGDIIPHYDLVKNISIKTNKKYGSARGTLFIGDKHTNETLNGTDFVFIKTPNGSYIIRKNTDVYDLYKDYIYSYNTEEKQKSREFIFSHIYDGDTIMTFSGSEGLDISFLRSNYNNITIYNIEKNNTYYNMYLNTEYSDTTINYNINFFDFYKNNNKYFNLLNYDSISYLCESVSKDIILMNEKPNSDILAITLLKVEEGVRNTGNFAKTIRNKYKNSKQITTDYLKDTLTNYEHIDTYEYKRDKNTQPMKVYIFKNKQKK